MRKHIKAVLFTVLMLIFGFALMSCAQNNKPEVERTYINDSGRVIVVMSDGSEIDAGPCPEDELPDPQIKKMFVNEKYHLMIEYTNGKTADMGYVGIKDESKPDIITITETKVDKDHNLIVSYSDGTSKNLGYVGVEVIKEVVVEVEVPVYTVNFVGKNGEEIKSQCVVRGKNATAPKDIPVYEHYQFKGWSVDFTNVNSDLTVKAIYEKDPKYLVFFYDSDGGILSTQSVYHGDAAQAPEAPSKRGFRFVGWDKDFSSVTEKMSITAVYEYIDVFKVYFFDGNNVIGGGPFYVTEGTAAVPPEAPQKEGYRFVGWDGDYSCIVKDNTYIYAIYEKIEEGADNQ